MRLVRRRRRGRAGRAGVAVPVVLGHAATHERRLMDQRGPDCLHDGWELKSCSSRTGQWEQWTRWVLVMA